MFDPVIITVPERSGAHYPFSTVPMRAASPLSETLQL
jgi:hypothetical protein